MAPRKKKPTSFRFRDLPIEIQIQVFHYLKSQLKPHPTTRAHRVTLWRWARQTLTWDWPPSLFSDPSGPWITARSLMMADSASFKDFAPHYYAFSSFRFCNPIEFANQFLANTTHACLYNLRYVSCVLNAKDSEFDSIKKTGEMLEVWSELRRLSRFELVYIIEGVSDSPKPYPEGAMRDKEDIWANIDNAHNNAFSNFERRALDTTFKGFEAVRNIKLKTLEHRGHSKVYIGCDVEHLSVTFTKDGP